MKASNAVDAILAGEGLPYLLDAFTVVLHDPEAVKNHVTLSPLGKHSRELPAEGDVLHIEP